MGCFTFEIQLGSKDAWKPQSPCRDTSKADIVADINNFVENRMSDVSKK